jgi:hypothetical protein
MQIILTRGGLPLALNNLFLLWNSMGFTSYMKSVFWMLGRFGKVRSVGGVICDYFIGVASLHEFGDRRSKGDFEECGEDVFHMLQKFASLTTPSSVSNSPTPLPPPSPLRIHQ